MILYINDFSGVSDKLFFILFADHTNVFLSSKDLKTLIDTIQLELSNLFAWLHANKLTLIISKTHFMIFHRARHKNYRINIKINKVSLNKLNI